MKNIYNVKSGNVKLGEASIDVDIKGEREHIIHEIYCTNKCEKTIIENDAIGLTCYHKIIKNNNQVIVEESIRKIDDNKYIIMMNNKQMNYIYGNPICSFEKVLFVPLKQIKELYDRANFLDTKAIKVFKLKYLELEKKNMYKILIPEKYVVSYDDDLVAERILNLENQIEIIKQ